MNAKEINRAIDEAARLFAGRPRRRGGGNGLLQRPALIRLCSWVMEQAHKKG
ncbi:MAG: hypothetical protein ACLSB9_00190 [Hydrogeniiclostridium mannosilyticum]